MMTYQKYIYTFVCLYLCTVFDVVSADEACEKSKCKGPIKYYEDLHCIPTYSAEDSCCAVKYNCDHLEGRSEDKCYYKGHEYSVGENLREEDAKPCDIGCTCAPGWNGGAAHFTCAAVDCFNRPEPGCYLKNTPGHCCAGPQVCPRDNPDIAKCEVDGKTYYDSQSFTPSSDPTLSCTCSEGYAGENVAPFCKPAEEPVYSCDVELRHADDIYNNCTPTFYSSQNPATSCNLSSRCQNKNDVVVKNEDSTRAGAIPASDPDLSCKFGNLKMNIGDQLNQGTDYSSVCVKCVCEVPPIPTCQRLPDNECDVTVHRSFDNLSK